MAVRNELPCRKSGCTSPATWHVQYKQGQSYVKSHFCGYHSTSETANFERTLGLDATSRPVSNACLRGRC